MMGFRSELRGTRHTLVTVLEGLLRGAPDHSVHHRNHLAACEGHLQYYRRHHHAAAVLAEYNAAQVDETRWPIPVAEAGDRRGTYLTFVRKMNARANRWNCCCAAGE